MKKQLVTLLVTALLPISTLACDICSSGAGSNYVGLLPDYNSKVLGLRFRYNNLYSDLSSKGEVTHLSHTESYMISELYASAAYKNKWRFMAVLPYTYASKRNIQSQETKTINGISDGVLSASYQVFQQFIQKENRRIAHELWAGVGLKVPLGRYQGKVSVTDNLNLFQLGSGSWDMLLMGTYDAKVNNWGVNLNTQYKLNTQNKDQYRYGSSFNSSVQFYYQSSVKDWNFKPNVGWLHESLKANVDRGFLLERTGGFASFLMMGTEFNYKKVAFGIAGQLPIKQEIAKQTARNHYRLMTHFTLLF